MFTLNNFEGSAIQPPQRRTQRAWRSRVVDTGNATVVVTRNLATGERMLWWCDPGLAPRLSRFSWSVHNPNQDGGYASTNALIDGVKVKVYLHHVIFDAPPTPHADGVIDHVDGDRRNNRLTNLQPLSHRKNVAKSKAGIPGMPRCNIYRTCVEVLVSPHENGCPTIPGTGRAALAAAYRLSRRILRCVEDGTDARMTRFALRDEIVAQMQADQDRKFRVDAWGSRCYEWCLGRPAGMLECYPKIAETGARWFSDSLLRDEL